jgi:hypothetical protein
VSGNEKAAAPATASAAGMTGPQPPLLEVTDLTTHYQVRRGVTERLTRTPSNGCTPWTGSPSAWPAAR